VTSVYIPKSSESHETRHGIFSGTFGVDLTSI
jgi:hypothetical protein